jgi:hypothetical protein
MVIPFKRLGEILQRLESDSSMLLRRHPAWLFIAFNNKNKYAYGLELYQKPMATNVKPCNKPSGTGAQINHIIDLP